MAHHEHETGTSQAEKSLSALPMKEDTMDAMTINGEDVRHELQELEKGRPCKQPRRLGREPPERRRKPGDRGHGGHAGRHRRGRGGGRHRAGGRACFSA